MNRIFKGTFALALTSACAVVMATSPATAQLVRPAAPASAPTKSVPSAKAGSGPLKPASSASAAGASGKNSAKASQSPNELARLSKPETIQDVPRQRLIVSKIEMAPPAAVLTLTSPGKPQITLKVPSATVTARNLKVGDELAAASAAPAAHRPGERKGPPDSFRVIEKPVAKP